MDIRKLTDYSTGVVVKVTGPNSMSSPGPVPEFRSWPTAFNVTVKLADPVNGRLRTHLIGRVWAGRSGEWVSELSPDVGGSGQGEHASSKAAVEAVKRQFKLKRGL